MLAMVLHRHADIASRPLRLEDRPDPRPRRGELLIEVLCCAICRTDLHVIEGELPERPLPIVPGHQFVGRVIAAGEGGTGEFEVGARVGVAWLRHTCGECRFCRAGRENLCEAARFTGYDEDGGFAERAVVPEAFAYRLPTGLSDVEAAPLLCSGIIGYRALERSELPAGGRLGLWGFGASAHVVLQLARRRGARVFVVTREGRHRDLARELGAEWAGPAGAQPPERLDSAIIFAPSGALVPEALAALDKGGTLSLAGIHMTPIPELDYDALLFFERSIRSVTANTRVDGRRLLQEAAGGVVRPRITTFPLGRANEALIALKRDEIAGSGVLVMKP